MHVYEHLPTRVEAQQWFTSSRDEDFPMVERYTGDSLCLRCGGYYGDHGYIETPEGNLHLCSGDWVAIGSGENYYPIKQNVFATSYTRVSKPM